MTDANNRFGHRAGAFVRGALDECISPESLIDRHSTFPYFASQLTESVATRWRTALIDGHPDAFRRYLPATKYGLRSTHALRYCPDCQQSDLEQFGLAHWHVAHQLPGIRFCPRHTRLLQDRCRSCKAPFEAKTRGILPGEACQRCGSHDTDSSLSKRLSDGYLSLADLTCRTLQKQAPEAAPMVRHLLLMQLIDTAGLTAAELVNRFLAWWSVEELHQLELLLQAPVEAKALQQLMQEGHAKVSTPLMLAVIAFAWAHTPESDRQRLLEGHSGEDDLFSGTHLDDSPRGDMLDQLIELTRQLHLPRQAAELLSRGDRASATELIGRTNVISLLEGVTEKSRGLLGQRIQQHQSAARRHTTRKARV